MKKLYTNPVFYARLTCMLAGAVWLFAGRHPLLATASLLVPLLAIPAQRRWQARLLCAAGYFLPATSPVVASYEAFFAPHSGLPGVLVWLVVAGLLAAPWALARGPWTTLLAAGLSGLLGPLSIWPLAGLLFPGIGLVGLAAFAGIVFCVGEVAAMVLQNKPAPVTAAMGSFLLGAVVVVSLTGIIRADPKPPAGWVAVNTRGLVQTGNDVFSGLRNTQRVIAAGRAFPDASVLVFPEAALNDMLPGTAALVSQAIPAGQTWLIGAEDGKHDAVWRFAHGQQPAMVSDSVLPMPVSMWRPWSPAVSYQPAWWKTTFSMAGQQVWLSLCYEQVVPWSWVQALVARPSIVLLQSNAWWADKNNAAPAIQAAQAGDWLRLMGVPFVVVQNKMLYKRHYS